MTEMRSQAATATHPASTFGTWILSPRQLRRFQAEESVDGSMPDFSQSVVARSAVVFADGDWRANDELFLSGDVAQSLALGKLRDPKNTGDIEGVKKLSAREFQCMMMIVNGQGTQEISEVLELSPKTVSTYRHRLYEKIGVENDVELTHFAIRNALVSA